MHQENGPQVLPEPGHSCALLHNKDRHTLPASEPERQITAQLPWPQEAGEAQQDWGAPGSQAGGGGAGLQSPGLACPGPQFNPWRHVWLCKRGPCPKDPTWAALAREVVLPGAAPPQGMGRRTTLATPRQPHPPPSAASPRASPRYLHIWDQQQL